MNNFDILEAFNNVDDECLVNAKTNTVPIRNSFHWLKRISAAACFLLVVAVTISTVGFFNKPANNSEVPNDLDMIIWEKQTVGGDIPDNAIESRYTWKDKKVSKSLLQALKDAGGSDWFAICIGFAHAEYAADYVYDGKTVSEWEAQRKEYVDLAYEFLPQLLKEGDYLKLGEKIYTEGAPDGTKYVKSLYEERVAYYGMELLDKYILNGEFDEAQVEKDIEETVEKTEESEKIIYEGKSLFLKEKATVGYDLLMQMGFNVEFKNDHGFLFITKNEFSELSGSEWCDYIFSLASRKAFEDVSIPVMEEPVSKTALEKIYVIGNNGYIRPETNEEFSDAVNALVEKWFYTYDELDIAINVEKGSAAPDFLKLKEYRIEVVTSKYLSYDKYIITVPYENIDLEVIAQIAGGADVIRIIIDIPMQPDVAEEE